MRQLWDAAISVGPSQLPRDTVTWQLQENVFPFWSVPRLRHKDQRDKLVSLESLETEELKEWKVGVRWPLACEVVSPGTDEPPLLEDVTQQRSEDRHWEH
jgi:hypothetical protein